MEIWPSSNMGHMGIWSKFSRWQKIIPHSCSDPWVGLALQNSDLKDSMKSSNVAGSTSIARLFAGQLAAHILAQKSSQIRFGDSFSGIFIEPRFLSHYPNDYIQLSQWYPMIIPFIVPILPLLKATIHHDQRNRCVSQRKSIASPTWPPRTSRVP